MLIFNGHIIHKTEGFHGTIFDAGFWWTDQLVEWFIDSGLIYGRVVQKNNIIYI